MKKVLFIIIGLLVLTSCDIDFPSFPDFDVNNEENNNNNNNNNNNDNNNDNNGSDSNVKDSDDFNFHMYIEKGFVSSGYIYLLFFGFGHEYGIWYDGITEFGIEMRAIGGTITNKSGWNDDYVKVSKSNGWTYFSTGTNGTNQNDDWNTSVIVDSPNSTIEIEWRPKWYNDNTGRWMTSYINRKTFSAN